MKRRNVLKLGASSVCALGLGGLTSFTPPQARAATVNVSLVCEARDVTLPDNSGTVTQWRFVDPLNGGPGQLDAGLALSDTDELVVELTNRLPVSVNFAISGVLSGTPACPPGQTRTYRLPAPAAGSYFFFDEQNGEAGRAMGLFGPMVVTSSTGIPEIYPGGPSFDRAYTLTWHELDTRLNAVLASGQNVDLDQYEPDYFFVNGLSYPATGTDASTDLLMQLGEQVALRLINCGLIYNSVHFHGFHVNVIARDRIPQTDIVTKDTVLVAPGETVDVMVPVTQRGLYPVHNHFLPAVTANGVYPNGALLIIRAL